MPNIFNTKLSLSLFLNSYVLCIIFRSVKIESISKNYYSCLCYILNLLEFFNCNFKLTFMLISIADITNKHINKDLYIKNGYRFYDFQLNII